jgi:hypothetical protein
MSYDTGGIEKLAGNAYIRNFFNTFCTDFPDCSNHGLATFCARLFDTGMASDFSSHLVWDLFYLLDGYFGGGETLLVRPHVHRDVRSANTFSPVCSRIYPKGFVADQTQYAAAIHPAPCFLIIAMDK